MHALVAAGADVIELGVPFSDPMADGPTIQRSYRARARARRRPARTCSTACASSATQDADDAGGVDGLPQPGRDPRQRALRRRGAAAGVDGVLLVDLPPEEVGSNCARRSRVHGLALILLASPTTADARLARLCADARATCTTSASPASPAPTVSTPPPPARDCARSAPRPACRCVAGFGIRDAASAAAMAVDADGVVVGSALVAALPKPTTIADAAGAGRPVPCAVAGRRWTAAPSQRQHGPALDCPRRPSSPSSLERMSWLKKLMPAAHPHRSARGHASAACRKGCGKNATAAARCCTGRSSRKTSRSARSATSTCRSGRACA